jgi:hypothetical protein
VLKRRYAAETERWGGGKKRKKKRQKKKKESFSAPLLGAVDG